MNHTMAQMLDMIVNKLQNDWKLHRPHIKFACNNSARSTTGLAPNEDHMGTLPSVPLTVFDRTDYVGHQTLAWDHLADRDVATVRVKRVDDIVRAHHAPTIHRVNRRISNVADAMHPAPNFTAGGWA